MSEFEFDFGLPIAPLCEEAFISYAEHARYVSERTEGTREVLNELRSLACRATEADTDRTREKLIGKLLIVAKSKTDAIHGIEATDDPVEIARNALNLVTVDIRDIFTESSPMSRGNDDKYSMELEVRRQNLPRVLELFDVMVNGVKD
ncbi:MAG TPA: hypothetical protein VLG25_03135 [Patescibacteria group bacterium]|nr:hypothetical protein [Patescibacteria group bacterium]